MRRIHIFKAGTHRSTTGHEFAFSEADLAATASAYDPALHEAPLVIGHPKTDDPAYGWTKSVAVAADGLFAVPHEVQPAFSELVDSKAFKKISAKFYGKDDPANPVPGVYYLRHIGFLGAQPPAIKGLKGIEFSDAGDGIEFELEFSEAEDAMVWALDDIVAALRAMREHVIEKEGIESADKVLPGWRLESLTASATRARAALAKAPGLAPAFSETTTQEITTVKPEEAAALQALNAKLQAEIAAGQAELATARAGMRASAVAANTAAHAAFAEALIADARIATADKAVVTALLDFAEPAVIQGEDAPAVVEFGEGEAKQPIGAAIKAFLQGLPQRVGTGEQASRDRAAATNGAGQGDELQYAEGTPQDQIDLDKRIRAHAKAHSLTYAESAVAIASLPTKA